MESPREFEVGNKVITIDSLTEEERFAAMDAQAAKKSALNFSSIPEDDKKTWDLICSGLTKGIFQLEKSLGKRYCKEIAPRSIEELSDVISLIRPGCLEAEFREKPESPGEYSSITNTYIKIKNGEWSPEYISDALEPILKETHSVPIYQEQIMRICTDFAGFTLKEADKMRKAVGKKQSEEVFVELEKMFVSSAIEKMGRDEDTARTIFSWIKKFSGYGFNKSHAVSYADVGYKTAYSKANYPIQFFKSMLENSDGKQDSLEEIQELVHEARLFHIDVRPPRLNRKNRGFEVNDSGQINFGLAHIKGVGEGAVESIEKIADVCESSNDFLIHSLGLNGSKDYKLRSNVAQALIKSGCLDYLNPKRIVLLAQYEMLSNLTEREKKFVGDLISQGALVNDAVLALLDSKIPNKTRRPKIQEIGQEINRKYAGNHKRMSIAYEKFLLGIPLSGSLVELYYNPRVDIKCRDFHRLKDRDSGHIGVVIEGIKQIKDKNSNDMCFLTVSDETYMMEVIVFASTFPKVAWILEEGKPVLISGRKSKTSFIANTIDHL